MRAVIAVVLPDVPDQPNGELAAMISQVGAALDGTGLPVRVLITIRETAEAVLAAAEPPKGTP
jgi:hypothetical protein